MKKKFLLKAMAAVLLMTPVTGNLVARNANVVFAQTKSLKVLRSRLEPFILK